MMFKSMQDVSSRNFCLKIVSYLKTDVQGEESILRL